MIVYTMSDDAVMRELGERLRRHRIAMDRTQKELAHEAGVSKRTLERLEDGQPAQLLNFLRVLRALGLLENLEAVVPRPLKSPLRKEERQRASGRPRPKTSWEWGDT